VAGARTGAGVAGDARGSRHFATARRTGAGRATAGAQALNQTNEANWPDRLPDNALLALEAFERAQAEAADGNSACARRWLERACRLAPQDQTLSLALASACLGHDDMRAASLFAAISAASDVREAWFGLATARRLLGDTAAAAAALAEALARHVLGRGHDALADAIVRDVGAPGWCGLSGNGTVTIGPDDLARRVELRLDGRRVRGAVGQLPNGWQDARALAVTVRDGGHLLGSPVSIRAIRRTVGCVTTADGGLAGWAWHPGDPDTDPVLTIRSAVTRGRLSGAADGKRTMTVTASDSAIQIDNIGLLGRPRGFRLSPAALVGLPGPLHVLDHYARDLLGSPLDPGAMQSSNAAAATTLSRLYPAHLARYRATGIAVPPPAIPVDGNVPCRPIGLSRRRRVADIVIPVHGGTARTLACLNSVLANLTSPSRVIVIDDASPEPDLVEALDGLARRRRIRLIRNRRNQGFSASANAGLKAAPDRDVILLNSDTLVTPGWADDLRAAAYSAPDIGTVTPLANDATILSYPSRTGANAVPDLRETMRLATLTRRVNGGSVVDIPVGVGFCMYIRRDCLDAVGLLRADVFAQGYGEENDFCLRARHLGWRHVAAPGVFVAHVGGQSFGMAACYLRARNSAILEHMHPGYAALIQQHATADPLAPARRRLDLARWHADRGHADRVRGGESTILITHNDGGGVERQVAVSVARHRAAGRRAIVLRPGRLPDGSRCVAISDGTTDGFPNLRYAMPAELPALLRLLTRERPREVELHHMVGHHRAILDLVAGLGVPYDVHVHDYAWLCGRVALVGPENRYCGEPDVVRCEACVADAGSMIDEDISVADLRKRSARLFADARRVIAPSRDTAARICRHFPATRVTVEPHEDDAAIVAPGQPATTEARCRVCVVGAIGIHKGYQIVLDCARDAAERRLPLEFVVVGHTIDDGRLLATGRVFVTGGFAPEEAVQLIRAQNATLALLPSIWPETWCFGLSEAWRAGLQVAAFDIGAPAERIRRTGRGFLLPLGLKPDAINNALVAKAGLSHHK
jgi:GT2 family glycosyltransferase/glycosyltransferase involved in cell wall biosynthesis